MISGERLKTLGKILGITDEYMNEVAEQIDISYASLVQYEEFQMYYFEIFQLIDDLKI